MKLITLHQPWASLIALGWKEYETRSWLTQYRGKLLIHAAAKHPKIEEICWFKDFINGTHPDVPLTTTRDVYSLLPLGCVIAVADLTRCRPMNASFIKSVSIQEKEFGNWEPGRYAFQLTNVQPLPSPIPFTSRQGKLLEVPPSLVAMVSRQIQEGDRPDSDRPLV